MGTTPSRNCRSARGLSCGRVDGVEASRCRRACGGSACGGSLGRRRPGPSAAAAEARNHQRGVQRPTNAVGATRPGGTLILDDMQNPGPRRAFEESVRRGWLVEPKCVDGVPIDVSYVHRFDSSNVRRLNMSWCSARVSDVPPPELVVDKVIS